MINIQTAVTILLKNNDIKKKFCQWTFYPTLRLTSQQPGHKNALCVASFTIRKNLYLYGAYSSPIYDMKTDFRLLLLTGLFTALTFTESSAQKLKLDGWAWINHPNPFGKTDNHTVDHIDNTTFVVMAGNKPSFIWEEVTPYANNYYKVQDRKKPVVTASAFANVPGEGKMWLMFSSAKNKANRKLLLKNWLNTPGRKFKNETTVIGLQKFFKRVLHMARGQFKKLDIQAATAAGSYLVLVNARNNSTKDNYVIATNLNFYKRGEAGNRADLSLRKFIADDSASGKLSITGLTYVPQRKLLLYVASDNSNKKKSRSFIGWISDFENKMNSFELKTDKIVSLPSLNAEFKDNLIESIAFKNLSGNAINLVLSDNLKVYNVSLEIK